MEIKELKVFLDSTVKFFAKITNEKARVGVPSLLRAEEDFLEEITGAIGVAGSIQGAIYITAKEIVFKELLHCFNPVAEQTEENILDIAGELANTIAGNAQSSFGKDFKISVPMIFTGTNGKIRMNEPKYVIPIDWKDKRIHLVVGLSI